jgi:AcrR family transcriptional regulator
MKDPTMVVKQPILENNRDSRERVLAAAEKLFTERGYTAVTLKDIADALGIRQASLYYHAPGGKESLFIEVTERILHRYREGLQHAIASAGPDIRHQVHAAAHWLISQPMMNLNRMTTSDMPEIDPRHAERLEWLAYESLLVPLDQIFIHGIQSHQIAPDTPDRLGGMLLSIVEGIHALPDRYVTYGKSIIVDDMIDIMFNGLLPRR